MKSCKEMAKQWGVTERTVTTFCKTGKIPGVVKEGKSWRIPDGAEKPADGRVLSGKYVKKEGKCAVIVHRNGETSVRDSLSAVEKALGSREFIVADRGYLANIRHVMKMKSRELYMRNGNIITVGRERFKHVRKAILDYWKEI